jgi:hypothetical protein
MSGSEIDKFNILFWICFGVRVFSLGCLAVVPGGRVELPTPAFSGPRSTGELPRHFGSEKIVRAQGA